MSILIKNPIADQNIRELALLRGQSLTEAINVAVENELRKERRKNLPERLNEMLAQFEHLPRTNFKADKAFFDEMSGDI